MSLSFHKVDNKNPDVHTEIFSKFYKAHLKTIMTYQAEDSKLTAEITRLNEGLKNFELDLYKKKKRLPFVEKKFYKVDYKTKCLQNNSKQCSESLANIRIKLKNLEESIAGQKVKSANQITEFQDLENTIDDQLKTIESNISHIHAARRDVEMSHQATVESCYQSEVFTKQCFSRYLDIWPQVQIWLSFEPSNITSINGTASVEGIIGEWSFYRAIASCFQDLNENFDPFNLKTGKSSKGGDAFYTKQQPLDKLKLFLQTRYKKLQQLSAVLTAQVMQLESTRKAHKTMMMELLLALEEDFSFSCLQCENEATSPLGYALAMKTKLIQKQLEKLRKEGFAVNSQMNGSQVLNNNSMPYTGSVMSSVAGNPIYEVTGQHENKAQESTFSQQQQQQLQQQQQSMNAGRADGLTDFEASMLNNQGFYDSLLDPNINNVELTHPKFSYPLCKNSKLVCHKWFNKVRLKDNFLSSFATKVINERRFERVSKLYRFKAASDTTSSEILAIDHLGHRRKQLVMRAWIELKTVLDHASLMAYQVADQSLDKVILSLEKLNSFPTEQTTLKVTEGSGVSQEAVSVILDNTGGPGGLPNNVAQRTSIVENEDPYKDIKESFSNMEQYYSEKESKANSRVKMRKFLLRDWFAFNELSLQASLSAKCPHLSSEEIYRDRCVKAIRLLKKRYLSVRRKAPEAEKVEKDKAEKKVFDKSAVKGKNVHEVAVLMETNPDNFELDIFDENGVSMSEVAARVDNGRLLFQSTCRVSGELLNISLFWQSEFERVKLEARSVVFGKIDLYMILITRNEINEVFVGQPFTEADMISKSKSSGDAKSGPSFGERILSVLRVEMLSSAVAFNITKKSRTLGNKVAFKSAPPATDLNENNEIREIRLLTIRNKEGDLIACSFGKQVAR